MDGREKSERQPRQEGRGGTREGEGNGVGGFGWVGRREVWCRMSGGDIMGIRLQRNKEEKEKKEGKKEITVGRK